MPASTKSNVVPIDSGGALEPRQISPETLTRWIKSGAPRSEIDVLLTPDLAKILLNHNKAGETNRRMTDLHMRQIRYAVSAGLWENTGEPIIVSDEKLLNDGQYRCEAVVHTKVPIVVDLRFGIKRSAFSWTNSGRQRTAGDALSVSGINNHHRTAALTRIVIAYQRGLPDGYHQPVGNGEISAAVERWPDVVAAGALAQRLKQPFRSGIVGAVVFFANRTDPERAEQFLETIATGAAEATDPVHQWREYMIRHPLAYGSRGQRLVILALGIIAWNHYRVGDRSRLRLRQADPFPVVEGLVL